MLPDVTYFLLLFCHLIFQDLQPGLGYFFPPPTAEQQGIELQHLSVSLATVETRNEAEIVLFDLPCALGHV